MEAIIRKEDGSVVSPYCVSTSSPARVSLALDILHVALQVGITTQVNDGIDTHSTSNTLTFNSTLLPVVGSTMKSRTVYSMPHRQPCIWFTQPALNIT